jgi:hypothetical protein
VYVFNIPLDFLLIYQGKYDRSVAQLVERRSPKPEVAGSIPVAPARLRSSELCPAWPN